MNDYKISRIQNRGIETEVIVKFYTGNLVNGEYSRTGVTEEVKYTFLGAVPFPRIQAALNKELEVKGSPIPEQVTKSNSAPIKTKEIL